jgi:hypothetical protein
MTPLDVMWVGLCGGSGGQAPVLGDTVKESLILATGYRRGGRSSERQPARPHCACDRRLSAISVDAVRACPLHLDTSRLLHANPRSDKHRVGRCAAIFAAGRKRHRRKASEAGSPSDRRLRRAAAEGGRQGDCPAPCALRWTHHGQHGARNDGEGSAARSPDRSKSLLCAA